jgi:hypothetical protein
LNRWTLIRNNVIAALRALPFPDGVAIEKISRPTGIDGVVAPVAIGVCLAGDRWFVQDEEIANHENMPASIMVQIVIRADSAHDATGALDEQDAIEDISAIALKVRNVDIGIYGYDDDLNTGGVFLDGLRSDFLEFTGREPGGAGPIAKVFTLQTTVLPL